MSALTLHKLEDAYIKTYENALELFEESEILLENKKYARAYFLAQICYEELAKLPIILHEITRSFYKEKHDWKKFYKRLRNHSEKNRMNIVMELLFDVPDEHFKDIDQRTKMLNTLKNASLYSDLDGGNFFKPSDIIDEESAINRINATETYLDFFTSAKLHEKGTYEKIMKSKKINSYRELMKGMNSFID